MTKPKIIFFGNGPLADAALTILKDSCEVVFHAKTKQDLEEVKRLKSADHTGELHGILASFGVMIKSDVLDLFEPEGILNVHPSLLPKYRGPSPIETAILCGDKSFSVSIMKLVKTMDAGPVFYQTTFSEQEIFEDPSTVSAQDYKPAIYQTLGQSGAKWIVDNLTSLPEPTEQSGEPTFCQKFDKSMSPLDPAHKSAEVLLQEIRAFSGFPKSKYSFFDQDCTIISAHVATREESAQYINNVHTLYIQCHDKSVLIIDQIQPAGRKIMDAKSFINGYKK